MRKWAWVLPLLCFLLWTIFPALGLAADGGGYLAGYEGQDPVPNGTPGVSWWSAFAYIASLVVVFLFVAFLAYVASRFLGARFGRVLTGGNGRVLTSVSLGPGRSVCAVAIAGRVFLLGVTEHEVSLLREIEDEEEKQRLLQASPQEEPVPESPLQRQLASLEALARRMPSAFRKHDR